MLRIPGLVEVNVAELTILINNRAEAAVVAGETVTLPDESTVDVPGVSLPAVIPGIRGRDCRARSESVTQTVIRRPRR